MSARITGAFRVEEAGVSRGGRYCVRLLEPLEYRVGSAESPEAIIVPAGFLTDWASVPWWADGLIPAFGEHARPAIVHDFLYATKGTGMLPGDTVRRVTPTSGYTRAQADKIFLEAMEVVGVPKWKRSLMYRAVRIGGGKGWGA